MKEITPDPKKLKIEPLYRSFFDRYRVYTAETRTILTCHMNLNKKDMLEALSVDFIIINNHHYKVPERQILEYLLNREFGEVSFEFERIDNQTKQ